VARKTYKYSDVGVVAEDLAPALRALKQVDKDAAKHVTDSLKDSAKSVQTEAKARLSRRPGGGTYKRSPGGIRVFSEQRGTGITLAARRYPWLAGAEYGAKQAWVFGRVTTQGRLRRRQFPVWRGNQFVVRGKSGPGWIVQPSIRRQLPRIIDDAEEAIGDTFTQAMRQQGVGRG